jgi:hypothetical protein
MAGIARSSGFVASSDNETALDATGRTTFFHCRWQRSAGIGVPATAGILGGVFGFASEKIRFLQGQMFRSCPDLLPQSCRCAKRRAYEPEVVRVTGSVVPPSLVFPRQARLSHCAMEVNA